MVSRLEQSQQLCSQLSMAFCITATHPSFAQKPGVMSVRGTIWGDKTRPYMLAIEHKHGRSRGEIGSYEIISVLCRLVGGGASKTVNLARLERNNRGRSGGEIKTWQRVSDEPVKSAERGDQDRGPRRLDENIVARLGGEA